MGTTAEMETPWQGEWDCAPAVLFDAIEASLVQGDVHSALGLLSSVRRRLEQPGPGPTRASHRLTEREQATLVLLPDGSLNQKDIARVLGISHNTLKTHLRSLYQKLGAHCRGEAIERAGLAGGRGPLEERRHLVAVQTS